MAARRGLPLATIPTHHFRGPPDLPCLVLPSGSMASNPPSVGTLPTGPPWPCPPGRAGTASAAVARASAAGGRGGPGSLSPGARPVEPQTRNGSLRRIKLRPSPRSARHPGGHTAVGVSSAQGPHPVRQCYVSRLHTASAAVGPTSAAGSPGESPAVRARGPGRSDTRPGRSYADGSGPDQCRPDTLAAVRLWGFLHLGILIPCT